MEYDVGQITFSCYSEFENREDAFDILTEIRNLDVPEFFTDTMINLDPEEEPYVIFTDSNNMVNFSLEDVEDSTKITGRVLFEYERLEDITSLIESLKEKTDLTIDSLSIPLTFHTEFDNLSIPVQESFQYQLKGFRFVKDSQEFIIQKDSEEDQVSMILMNQDEVAFDSLSQDLFEDWINQGKGLIEEMC